MSQAVPKGVGAIPKSGERFYLPELDVLRFFAFFAVFLFHLPEPFVFKYYGGSGPIGAAGRAGAFGVDLFFALSGYLITGLLLSEKSSSGDINLKAFYARRTLRIWPLYYFSIAFAFLLTLIPLGLKSGPQFDHPFFLPMKPSVYVFLSVFLFNFNFHECIMTRPLPFMGLLWTVSVEEQFYLFWPWFVRFIPRKQIVVVPVLMIAIACLVRATLTFDLHRLLWNYTFARLDPIAVGIVIALLPPLNPSAALRAVMVVLGIASWWFASGYCGLPFQNDALMISIGYPAIAIGSGLFLLATIRSRDLRGETAPVRGLVYLGKISYGLYVYSTIAYSFAALVLFKVLLPDSSLSLATFPIYVALAATLNICIAAISYRYLETPFLRLKERFARVPSRRI